MYLGVDCGTQGTKALLTDRNGVALGRGYSKHALIARESGAREQEPQWWIDALRLSVLQATVAAPKHPVRALAISAQQHGLVILDEDRAVIRPAKLWNDTETAFHNQALIERFGGKRAYYERFGILPLTGYTVSKLAWLKDHEPENFRRIRHILLPHEYLNFRLTGNLCAEFGDASGTAFFDVRSRTWIREVLDAIDEGTGRLFQALPRLVQPGALVGTVLPQVAEETGLSADCLVAAGGGDNMMAAIGTGNVREGVVTLSLGTSSTVYSYQEKPSFDTRDPSGNVAPFCSSSGGWLPLVCTMNATNVVSQTLELLGKTIDDIDRALAATRPGADGLVVVPFFNGERTPDLPHARGSIAGLSAGNFTAANMIRGVVEGVTFGILNGLHLILGGKTAERIRVTGGGARSAEWRQLLADATGAMIQVPVEEEAGCLGAAIQAIFCSDIARSAAAGPSAEESRSLEEIADRCVAIDDSKTATPRPELHQAYREVKLVYDRTVAALYPQPG